MLDRTLAWISLLLSIFGAIPTLYFFFNEQAVGGLLTLGTLAIVVLAVLTIRWLLSQPPFTLLNVEKKLEFKDSGAHKAVHADTRKVMANHKGITEFWFKDIGQSGSLDNVFINGEAPDLEEQRPGGSMGVGKRYPHHFEWRQQFKAALSMDIFDAFPDEREFYTHKVMDKTKRLTMTVRFDRGKRFRSARVFLGYGGASYEELKKADLTKTNDGCELELVVRRPKLGQEYRLEWDW